MIWNKECQKVLLWSKLCFFSFYIENSLITDSNSINDDESLKGTIRNILIPLKNSISASVKFQVMKMMFSTHINVIRSIVLRAHRVPTSRRYFHFSHDLGGWHLHCTWPLRHPLIWWIKRCFISWIRNHKTCCIRKKLFTKLKNRWNPWKTKHFRCLNTKWHSSFLMLPPFFLKNPSQSVLMQSAQPSLATSLY